MPLLVPVTSGELLPALLAEKKHGFSVDGSMEMVCWERPASEMLQLSINKNNRAVLKEAILLLFRLATTTTTTTTTSRTRIEKLFFPW